MKKDTLGFQSLQECSILISSIVVEIAGQLKTLQMIWEFPPLLYNLACCDQMHPTKHAPGNLKFLPDALSSQHDPNFAQTPLWKSTNTLIKHPDNLPIARGGPRSQVGIKLRDILHRPIKSPARPSAQTFRLLRFSERPGAQCGMTQGSATPLPLARWLRIRPAHTQRVQQPVRCENPNGDSFPTGIGTSDDEYATLRPERKSFKVNF